MAPHETIAMPVANKPVHEVVVVIEVSKRSGFLLPRHDVNAD